MGTCFLQGSGYNLLNFKVVGGTTKPTTPMENMIWVKTDTKIPRYDFSPHYPPYKSNNKNLITYPYYEKTTTANGVKFTVGSNGSVVASGTADANATFKISSTELTEADNHIILVPPGTYFVSGCPAGGSSSTYFIDVFEVLHPNSDKRIGRVYESGLKITLTSETWLRFSIVVMKGATVSNLVFKPQMEVGSAATSFVKGSADGQVWIVTGAYSEFGFNAIKRNGIYVYPVNVQQVISGKWTQQTSEIYRNSAWSSFWDGMLYKNGDEYIGVTGGWEIDSTSKKDTSSIRIGSADAATKFTGQAKTKNKINLSTFSKIEVLISEAYSTDVTAFAKVRVLDSSNTVVASKNIYSSSYEGTNLTVNLDISSINGDYYIDIVAGHEASGNRHSRVVVTSVRCA